MATVIKTLPQYIDQVSRDFFNLRKVSVITTHEGHEVLNSIAIEPYLEILKSRTVTVELNKADTDKYKYKPRLLSRYLYDTENLYYLILLLNDTTVERFVPKTISLINKSDRVLIENIINKEKSMGTI